MFLDIVSDLGLYSPILDTGVRFRTLVSDFRYECSILDIKTLLSVIYDQLENGRGKITI